MSEQRKEGMLEWHGRETAELRGSSRGLAVARLPLTWGCASQTQPSCDSDKHGDHCRPPSACRHPADSPRLCSGVAAAGA